MLKKFDRYRDYIRSIFEEGEEELKERSEFFQIDELELSQEVEAQAAHYAYIANLLAKATKERNKMKLEARVLEARVKRELEGLLEGGKKLTVDAIGARVTLDPRVIGANADFIAAEEIADHLQADVEACRQKGEMLKLLGISLKREQMIKGGI